MTFVVYHEYALQYYVVFQGHLLSNQIHYTTHYYFRRCNSRLQSGRYDVFQRQIQFMSQVVLEARLMWWKYWWVWWIISTIWWRKGPCRPCPNFSTSWYLILQIDARWWHFLLQNLINKRRVVLKCKIARRPNLKSVSGHLVGLGWVACRLAISRVCPNLIVQIQQQ